MNLKLLALATVLAIPAAAQQLQVPAVPGLPPAARQAAESIDPEHITGPRTLSLTGFVRRSRPRYSR